VERGTSIAAAHLDDAPSRVATAHGGVERHHSRWEGLSVQETSQRSSLQTEHPWTAREAVGCWPDGAVSEG
jgi:hypothetical protein